MAEMMTDTVKSTKRKTALKVPAAEVTAAVSSAAAEAKKKLLFVGAEVMPFAATGGLGDVLGSLPEALAAYDPALDVRVVVPLYSAFDA